MHQHIQLEIPIAWHYVRTVRETVDTALAEYPEEVRSAAVMVASELVENAIKYGTAIPALEWARFCFEKCPTHIEIQVLNGLTDQASWELLSAMVQQMQPPGASERLYVARLQELAEHPAPPNRLGLYRISYEGKFELACRYDAQILTMTARRQMR